MTDTHGPKLNLIADIALIILSWGAMLVAIGLVFFYAPQESVMGDVQRIFYFHVASAWVGFLAFAITALGSAGYLASYQLRWDRLAQASAEIGLTFITAALLSGMLWARPVWGVFWTWDPRLTITLVQLLLYLAYLLLRASIPVAEPRARLAAIYGAAAFVTVPLSWFAIRWWRTLHPNLLTGGGMAIAPRMQHTLWAALLAFTLCYLTLLRQRVRLARSAQRIAQLNQGEIQ